MYLVLTIKNNILSSVDFFSTDGEKAKKAFLATCRKRIPIFDEFPLRQQEAAMADGYIELENGSVCLIDGSNKFNAVNEEDQQSWVMGTKLVG